MQQRDWEGVCREVPQIFFFCGLFYSCIFYVILQVGVLLNLGLFTNSLPKYED